MQHVAACTIDFVLLYERDWQGRVLKLTKNDHLLVFLTIWILFPKRFWIVMG